MGPDLSGKVVIVTGGGRGIGRAIASNLANCGASLVVNDVSPPDEVVQEINERNGRAIACLADVSITKDVNRLVEQAVATYRTVHILVNNAGVTRDALLLRMSDEAWDQVLAVNLKGAFFCTRAVLRYMLKERWGRVINICSVVGVTGNAGQGNYASAKAGLIGFTKSIAQEVASRGITVNAIAPGFIDTDMTKKLSENIRQQIMKRIPVGHFGSPQDVAQAVAFLASPEASYITGHVLHVDGGMVMA